MKIVKITEDQMQAIIKDAINAYNDNISNYGEVPYLGYEKDFAKNYTSRLFEIIGAKDGDK